MKLFIIRQKIFPNWRSAKDILERFHYKGLLPIGEKVYCYYWEHDAIYKGIWSIDSHGAWWQDHEPTIWKK